MVFITGGITHASFGGLGLGFFLGISPTLSALFFAVLSALGVEWMSRRNGVREDSAIAAFWALGMAIGIICIFMTPGYTPELSEFLFGNILTITHADLILFSLYTAGLILVFILFYRHIVYTAFDRDFAATVGSRTSDRILHDIFGIGLRSSHNPFSRHHAVNVPTHCATNDIRSVL